jgi:hypothetical protein
MDTYFSATTTAISASFPPLIQLSSSTQLPLTQLFSQQPQHRLSSSSLQLPLQLSSQRQLFIYLFPPVSISVSLLLLWQDPQVFIALSFPNVSYSVYPTSS